MILTKLNDTRNILNLNLHGLKKKIEKILDEEKDIIAYELPVYLDITFNKYFKDEFYSGVWTGVNLDQKIDVPEGYSQDVFELEAEDIDDPESERIDIEDNNVAALLEIIDSLDCDLDTTLPLAYIHCRTESACAFIQEVALDRDLRTDKPKALILFATRVIRTEI